MRFPWPGWHAPVELDLLARLQVSRRTGVSGRKSNLMTSVQAKHDYELRLMMPFLVHALIFQVVTGLTRVTASYRAIELDVSYIWYGAISSGYALLPIFLAIPLGRYIDRGNDTRAIWVGSAFQLAANAGFWMWSMEPLALTAYSVVAGIGHLFTMAGHQALTLRCAGPVSREGVFGWYMVVLSIGQMIAPALIGWMAGSARLPPTAALFAIAFVLSIATIAIAFTLRPAPAASKEERAKPTTPLGEILAVPGLIPVILASVMTVASMDLAMIYLPLLGAERHVDAGHIGMILTVRALASIFSRIFYAPALRLFGRPAVTFWSMMIAAVGYALVALPLSLPWLYVSAVLIGFGLGLAVTVCLSNVVDLAPANARGTAMTIRLTGNRIGQFIIPFAGAVIAGATGVGGVFLIIAMGLMGVGAGVRPVLRKR